MRKQVSELIGTLQQSVLEITGSAADNKEDLLHKSLHEFHDAILGDLDPYLPAEPDEEMLAKGVSHIALFADTLAKAGLGVDLASMANAPAEHLAEMDRFLAVGELVLRKMANSTAEVVETDEDADLADAAGELYTLPTSDGDEVLIKSALPEHLAGYMTDPVNVLADGATLARMFQTDAIGMAQTLQKSEALPDDMVDAFPELFEQPRLRKADDETMGAGADPSAGDDPGDTIGDDATQDPIEIALRCISVAVVVLGSLKQAQGGNDMPVDQSGGDVSGYPDDGGGMAGPPLRRQEPMSVAPLGKILRGEVEVDDDLADYIEEAEEVKGALEELQKSLSAQQKDLNAERAETREAMRKMQETIDRLQAQPKPAQGVAMVVNKSEDYAFAGQQTPAERAEQLSKMAEADPDAAAKEVLKMLHRTGGQPLVGP